MPKYSIVVPLHNEQENVTDLYDRLKAVMETAGETFEIVLVDDGSNDHTFAMLREIAAVDSRVTVVKLRRNFGQTAGLAAGAPVKVYAVPQAPIAPAAGTLKAYVIAYYTGVMPST